MSLRSPFVGRCEERSRPEALGAEAAQGRGAVVLVSGALGIGKTPLREEFAEGARKRGALIAPGRWYESEEMPAYVGFGEALGELLQSARVRERLDRSIPYARDIARLVPEVASTSRLPRRRSAASPASPIDPTP